MRILVTGHDGYVGTVMLPHLSTAGHVVYGLDAGFFRGCTLGPELADPPATWADVRDVAREQLAGFDAVVHLAALSNDPLGNLNADTTYDINHHASVRLAKAAKAAGVPRFVFASSCSLYGVAGNDMLDESAPFNPITPYGISKARVEQDVGALADDTFSPTFMRNATAYGFSPRFRADIVVNNLVGHAFTTGTVLIQSDGTPWRPLLHVEDFCRAFRAVLEAPRERVHNQAFNVGLTSENYQVRDLADIVQARVPGATVTYAEGGGPDPRSYRVNCDKLVDAVPEARPQWTVARGVEQLIAAFEQHQLSADAFLGDRFLRIRRIETLRREDRLDESLRWRAPVREGSDA